MKPVRRRAFTGDINMKSPQLEVLGGRILQAKGTANTNALSYLKESQC